MAGTTTHRLAGRLRGCEMPELSRSGPAVAGVERGCTGAVARLHGCLYTIYPAQMQGVFLGQRGKS
jgi:hypothetical protein